MGKTKRGKSTKIMAVAEGVGLPISISFGSGWPHGVKLVEKTLEGCFVEHLPERMIGDRVFDSDPLDKELISRGIEMIGPHRSDRKKGATEDGRRLRRYRCRWKFERLFVWLQNFWRVLVRYDCYLENYIGFVLLGCIVILLRNYF